MKKKRGTFIVKGTPFHTRVPLVVYLEDNHTILRPATNCKAKMKLTILRPTADWARTAKSYASPSRDGKQSDYNLGTYFTFEDFNFSTFQELEAKLKSETKAILISGMPSELAIELGVVPRRTEYFPYPPSGKQVHCFDMDAWKIPAATRDLIKPSLTDTKSMGELVNAMLRNEGFDLIADADKLIVLTSSSWDLELLNCHVYVSFDDAISIESMREFATALAKVNQRTIFDPAIYKAVQPQFFTPPTCIGFKDPYKDTRIFHVPGKREIHLPYFSELVTKTLKLADWNPNSTQQNLPPIGTTWITTIREHVGDERGINEPSHRAAAQLVQSVGRNEVISNINQYAQQMYDEVWNTLARKQCARGSTQKDKSTYTIQRFRQYLHSACDKTFGDKVDVMVTQVKEAITAGLQGDMTKLTSAPVCHALRELKSKHYPQFLALETAIIDKHKLLKVRQLGNLIKAAADTGADGGQLVPTVDGWNENQIIDSVLQQYDYVSDHHGNKFAAVPGNGDGGYRMMRVDGSLVDIFYYDGLKLSGDQVGGAFGKKALSKLVGAEGKAAVSTFKECLIGTRVVSEDQTAATPTWINLGKQPDGQFRSARLGADGVTLMSHQDSKPKWFWNVPPLIIPGKDELNAKFNGFDSMMDYLQSGLRKYVAIDDYDMLKGIMWVCACMADKSLSYLLEVTGPPGSGKSTGADLLKNMIDPSGKTLGTGADRTAFWGVTSDFISDIERRYVTILDNISKLSPKEQDMLCMISTGMRHSERVLYTQSQMERVVRRPLVITALAPVITRPDLRSRVVSIEMDHIEYNPNFIEKWHDDQPYLTACMMQLTAKTLKLFRETTEKPRDIHERDVLLACVHSAMNGMDKTDYHYTQEFRLGEAEATAHDSSFINLFTRYMDEMGEGKNMLTFSTRALRDKLEEWALFNAGKKINGKVIRAEAVPETGRGLGWELSKNLDVIGKVGNWRLETKKKLANGIKYTFTRKNTLDNIDHLL